MTPAPACPEVAAILDELAAISARARAIEARVLARHPFLRFSIPRLGAPARAPGPAPRGEEHAVPGFFLIVPGEA